MHCSHVFKNCSLETKCACVASADFGFVKSLEGDSATTFLGLVFMALERVSNVLAFHFWIVHLLGWAADVVFWLFSWCLKFRIILCVGAFRAGTSLSYRVHVSLGMLVLSPKTSNWYHNDSVSTYVEHSHPLIPSSCSNSSCCFFLTPDFISSPSLVIVLVLVELKGVSRATSLSNVQGEVATTK